MALCLRTKKFHKDLSGCGEPAGALSVPQAVVRATRQLQVGTAIASRMGGKDVSWSAGRVDAITNFWL
eukprot:12417192-Karenia_brevis.AAC.1